MSGATSSAAAEGVGARTSATRSDKVVLVSWPIPDTTGAWLVYIALTTISSLKADNSSIAPPPQATITTSIELNSFSFSSAATMLFGASGPCTKVGERTISVTG